MPMAINKRMVAKKSMRADFLGRQFTKTSLSTPKLKDIIAV